MRCACSDGEHLLHNLDIQHIIMVRTRWQNQVSVGGCLWEKSNVGDPWEEETEAASFYATFDIYTCTNGRLGHCPEPD